jgi:hypothetical protein
MQRKDGHFDISVAEEGKKVFTQRNVTGELSNALTLLTKIPTD